MNSTSKQCEHSNTAKSRKASVDKKRARKKFTSQVIATHLLEANPDSFLAKSYERTLHCMETLSPNADGKLVAHYCKNRWCPVCQSIRIAILIEGYKPQLMALEDPYFVTLTRPTCYAHELPEQIKRMGEAFRKIKRRHKFRQVKGLRKAECTIRPHGKYHYHFHVIIEGKENAEYLIKEWLKLNPESKPRPQDMRPIDCKSMVELFKYFTKLLATDKSGERRMMSYKRLDVIFRALSGKRVFQPLGGLKMVTEEIDEETLEATRETAEQVYRWITTDWFGDKEGDALTNYEPNPNLIKLLDPANTLWDDS